MKTSFQPVFSAIHRTGASQPKAPRFGNQPKAALSETEVNAAKAAFAEILGVDPNADTNAFRAAFSRAIKAAFANSFPPAGQRLPDGEPEASQGRALAFVLGIKGNIETRLGEKLDSVKAFDLFTRVLNSSDQGLIAAVESGIELGPQDA